MPRHDGRGPLQAAHLHKCQVCRTRLYCAETPADVVGDLCPGCGSLLEPVGELAEIVGFRAITTRNGSGECGTPSTHQRLADRVGDLVTHRDTALTQARQDAEQWVDENRDSAAQTTPPIRFGRAAAGHQRAEMALVAVAPEHPVTVVDVPHDALVRVDARVKDILARHEAAAAS